MWVDIIVTVLSTEAQGRPAQASKSPLPVESHKTHSFPLATDSDNNLQWFVTDHMCETLSAMNLGARSFTGDWPCIYLLAAHTKPPDSQKEFSINYITYIKNV